MAGRRDAMFAGEKGPARPSIARRVACRLHASRWARGGTFVDGVDICPVVHAGLARMREFGEQVRSGAWRNRTGQAITDG